MKNVRGTLLVDGNSCCGVITTGSCSFQKGHIFLTKELNMADYAQIIRSRAVICENGGKTGHLAVICRILGIPVILLDDATNIFDDGHEVTVDCLTGRIFWGKRYVPKPRKSRDDVDLLHLVHQKDTHLQLSIVNELNIKEINTLGAVNVEHFFLREEFIWVRENINPFAYFKSKGRNGTTDLLVSNLLQCVKYLREGQLLNFRSLDMRSDEFRHFRGGIDFTEANPQLGLHGIRQLLLEPEFLIAELQALDFLYRQGFENVIFSLPFINDEQELKQVKALVKRHCTHEIKLGVFVETPAAVSELPYMISTGLTAVYIGTKDLTQMILASDRSNKKVAHIYDSRKRPVMSNIQAALNVCDRNNVPVFLFALYEDLHFFLTNLANLTRVSIGCAEYKRLIRLGNRQQYSAIAA
jgi:pyruvate, water dikinase